LTNSAWGWIHRGEITKTSISSSDGKLYFGFERDKFDEIRIKKLNFSMNEIPIFVDLGGNDGSSIHPDVIALCTILLCNPFVGKELYFPKKISRHFFEKVSSVISRYEISSEVDEGLKPNPRKTRGRPGLAFSGGADSGAALAILPRNAVPVFLNRPVDSKSKYDSDAPIKVCEKLSNCGYDVKIVDSNLELLREPTGFPTDLANGIPALLISDEMYLDSVSFGTVMESAFGLGHEHFIDYKNGAHWRFFSTLFSAAGLELCMPTIGISEVGTSIIASKSSIAGVSQSCIRGKYLKPCLNCWKCFRKELLSKSLGTSRNIDLASMMLSKEVQIRLSAFPISHENVITYSIQRIGAKKYPYLKPLTDKLQMKLDLNLMEFWYSGSIKHVPKKYRAIVRENILRFLDPMDIEHELILKNWNMDPHLESAKAKIAQENLAIYWEKFTAQFG